MGLLILAAADLVKAQDFKFTFGPTMEKEPSGKQVFFNTSLKKGYWVDVYNDFTITPMDGYLKFTGAGKPLKSETFSIGKGAALQGFHTINEKNYMMYSVLDKKQKSLTVYIQELSPDMVLLGSPIRMAEFKDIKTDEFLFSGPHSLRIVKSKSQRQIVLVKTKDSKVMMAGFSPEKGELWSKTFDLDSDYEFMVNGMKVAENGNVYFLGTYYKEKAYTNSGKTRNPFLLAYSPATKVQKLHTIKSADEKTYHLGYALGLATDETPLVAGIYSKKLKDGGYTIYTVDPNSLELVSFTSQPFSKRYMEVAYGKLWEPRGLSVTDVVQMSNGNIVLGMEGDRSFGMQHISNFYSTPMYVVAIDKSGVEKWNTTIEKDQAQAADPGMLGHILFYKGDKVYVVYNDNTDNFDLPPTGKQKESLLKNKTYVATAEIDNTGKTRKLYPVSTDKKEVCSLLMYQQHTIDNNLFQFMFKVGRTYQFATLQANE